MRNAIDRELQQSGMQKRSTQGCLKGVPAS
ncbi:hypothetical protein ES707_19177 [subsurface metagenome]